MKGPMKLVTGGRTPLWVEDALGHEWTIVGSYSMHEVLRAKWVCQRCRLGDVDDVAEHIREVGSNTRCPGKPLPGRVVDRRRIRLEDLDDHTLDASKYAVHVDTGQWEDQRDATAGRTATSETPGPTWTAEQREAYMRGTRVGKTAAQRADAERIRRATGIRMTTLEDLADQRTRR